MSVQQIVEAGRIAPAQLTGKSWKIKIIEGDRQGSSAYYPKEVLESGKGLFKKGLRIYKNHPSSEEKWSRPERSVDDIIGFLSEDAEYDGKDLYANATFFPEHQEFVKSRAEADVIGMSIRAEAQLTEGKNGMEVAKFMAVHSVDVVTTPGAGGGFEKLLESERPKVSASESVAESEKKEEIRMDKELATALDALVESNKTATAALTPLVEAVGKLVERADKEDKAKADALAEAEKPKAVDPLDVAKQLAESGLAPAAQARVLDAVKGGKELAESITSEKDYAKSILEEAGKSFTAHEPKDVQEAKASIGSTIYG
jgi:predicted transcriptional regulator